MLSVARLRAKLSRVPFSRRVFLALPAGAAAYGVQWRLTVANTDDSLALEEAAAYATASSPTTHEGGPTSASSAVAPAAHREAKWAQIVALSDRWDAYKAAKKATAEEMARVLADTARRAGRGGGTTEESRRRDEERLAAVEAKAAAVAAPPVLDLVVIGAGANGLFVTLEAARRGLSVATFEACDVGGASSSVGTPNTLTSFLPHFNRAIRVFSAEELWEGWGQLKELRQMGVYTTPPLLTPSPSPSSSSILSSDVGMVYAAASRLEAWDTVLTTALWAVSAAYIGAASPTGLVGPTAEQRRQQKRQGEGGAVNSFLSSSDVAALCGSAHMAAPGAAAIARLSEAVAPFLPLRPVSPSWLSLTSDWVGATDEADVDTQSGLQHSGDGAVVATVRPAAALYMRHSRIDGNAMAIALATTAERLSRGRLEAKRRAAEKSSSLANTHQQLTFSAASAAASEGLPDTAIILNYCPVQSVGVDPQTGLFRVTVKNLKMAPQDAKSRAARRAAGSEGTEDSRGTGAAPSYVTVTARNVVNCSGPWVDALRAAEVRGDVGCDDFSLRAAGRGGEETFAADPKETSSSSATTSDDPEVLALAGAAPSSEGAHAHGGGASSSLIAPADDTMGVLDSKGLRTPLPPRRLLREKAPEKASGYEVRQAFAGLDYDGEKMLMNSSSGHIYFVVRNSDMVAGDAGVRGCVRTAAPAEAEPADTGSEAKAAPSSASSSFFSRFFSTPHSVATLPHINSAMTLTSDAARRYVTVTPFGAPGAGLSLVGLSTVSLPLLGWRGEPPLSGLPFADVKSHFAPLYAWLRDISAESGIALPPTPLSCALSASGSMAPLSSIAREVYCSGNAAEAVRVKGAAEGSTLYHVVGGTWLTARRVGADVAADINRSRLAREATAKAADEAKARGSSAFMPPSDAEVGAMLAAAEAPFVRPLRLVGTSSSTVSASPSDEAVPAEAPSAAAEAKLVAAQLTAAMTGDPYVASLVDVIGRRTLVAYAHHAAVLRMLPALVEAMAAQQPRGYEWSAARRAEELAAAKAFMAGIAPPSSDDFTKKKL